MPFLVIVFEELPFDNTVFANDKCAGVGQSALVFQVKGFDRFAALITQQAIRKLFLFCECRYFRNRIIGQPYNLQPILGEL